MPAPNDRMRLLHTLAGVFPVGLFVLAHVIVQLGVLAGPAAYERAEIRLVAFALWPALEVVVLASLAFYVLYGVRLSFARAPRDGWYVGRDGLHLTQRVAGGIALAFLGVRLVTLRGARARGDLGLGDLHGAMVRALSSTAIGVPFAALGYIVGVAACAVFFANALASFVFATGVASSPRRVRVLGAACAVFGAALFLAGTDAVVMLATGSRHFWR